jgi:adenosylhomocysteine nucleosidase
MITTRKYGFLVIVIFCLFLLAHCGPARHQPDTTLILYAFDEEGQLLKEQMTIKETEKILGRDVYTGNLVGKDIILAESGVGMTNAAMTTQRLIDEYDPRRLIFTGIAGAIDTSVHIGDIVVCRRWIAHDYVYYGAEEPEPMGIWAFSPRKDSIMKMPYFEVDSAMYARLEEITEGIIQFKAIGDREPRLIVGSVGVSGNSFIDSYKKRVWLSETFGALITDMESAAVAQVCEVNDKPFIIFRSASDLAGGSGSESAGKEMDQFREVAAENSSILVMKFLEETE